MANQYALESKRRSRSDFLKEKLDEHRQQQRKARQEAAFRANYPGQIAEQGTSTSPLGDVLTGLLERLGMGGQRAYDVGQGVESAAELTPYGGIKKAARGDPSEALENLVGGPAGGAAKAMFLGLGSRLADKKALDTAKSMLAEGASREEVLKKTGWFQQHGDWKYEISDEPGQLSDEAVDKLLGKEGEVRGSLGPSGQSELFRQMPQQGLFDHVELFAAHPQLADLPTEASLHYGTSSGGYSPQRGIGVTGRGTGEVRDIGLHEMQHAVQEAEGFPRGGAPSDRSLQKAMGKIKPQAQQLYDRLDKERIDWIYQKAGIPEGERFGLESDAVRALDQAGKEWRQLNPEKGRLLDQYFGVGHMGGANARAGYHHLAGEVEARNTAKRKDMTLEQRRETPPWATQDVPDELQIVRRQVGEAGMEASDPTWWHPVSDTKLSRPFEEMTATYRDTGSMLPQKALKPEELQGSLLMPFVGDRTIAGKALTGINEVPFEKEVPLQGGPNFMRGPQQQAEGAAWASGKGVVSGLAKKIRQAAEGSGKDVVGVYSPMAVKSSDYADMTTKALMEQMKVAKVPTVVKKAFDAEMQAKVPGWPGIDKIDDQWIAGAGSGRQKLAETMALGKYQKAGFPDIGSTRKAINEPDLINTPTGEAGYAVSRMDPEGRVISNPSVPHTTYDTQLGGSYLGGLPMVPRRVMFPDWAATRPPGEPTPINDYAFSRQQPMQEANQHWLDQYMAFLEGRPTR